MKEFSSSKLQQNPSQIYNEVLRNRVARLTNQNRPDIIMVDSQHYEEMVAKIAHVEMPRSPMPREA